MTEELSNKILLQLECLRGDMTEIKGRLTGVEDNVTEMNTRLTGVEDNVTEINTRLTGVENNMTEMNMKLTEVKELAEFNKENCDSIKNVVTSHYMEFKKFVKSNNSQHNLYNAKLLQYNKEN